MSLLREDKNYNIGQIQLYDVQQEAVHFVLSRFNCILALQPGLGKTITVIVSAEHLMAKHPDVQVLILCPAEANNAFKSELKKIGRSYNIHTTQEDKSVKGAKYTILNHSSVQKLH